MCIYKRGNFLIHVKEFLHVGRCPVLFLKCAQPIPNLLPVSEIQWHKYKEFLLVFQLSASL